MDCETSSKANDEEMYDDDDMDYYDEAPLPNLAAWAALDALCYESPGSSACSSGAAANSAHNEDPEHFEYSCLDVCQVEQLFNEAVEALAAQIPVTPSLAKVLLHKNSWDVETLVRRYRDNCHELLVATHLKPPEPVASHLSAKRATACAVCCRAALPCSELRGLACGHQFCRQCWLLHIQTQLQQGVSTGLECMESGCGLLAPEDFVLNMLAARSDLRTKYQQYVFGDHVKSHPKLRFCTGPACDVIVFGQTDVGKRVCCQSCKTVFCFLCGGGYHAPTSCSTIKRWLAKCADDSETANYISAHTKDCPQCHACIEKSGGCNHMQCAKCKHHFCWMCLGDWKTHGSEYYECSRYKENPNVANEAVHVKARRALEKYLFYYERWENHHKSLQLEQQLSEKLRRRIETKVGAHQGTWIDWQYLHEAATLLTRCRYTLQYTYPFAFYLPPGPTKDLMPHRPANVIEQANVIEHVNKIEEIRYFNGVAFEFEYQQAQMEKEIEELSWKVERAETTDRGALEAQIHVARQKRLTLLHDFFAGNTHKQMDGEMQDNVSS